MTASAALGATPQPPATAPSTVPAPATRRWEVNYPVPYVPPQAQDIRRVLERVHARLDAAVPARIIDRETRQPVEDLSRPHPGAVLDSGPERHFGPYSYPLGVIYSGMLLSAEVTGDPRYSDFAAKRFQFFADNLPLLSKWDAQQQQQPPRRNPFRHLLAPDSLDACGAMGASMARARRMNVGPDLKDVLDRFADYISTKQFRLADGTLARNDPFPKSLWLDDAYMSVPMLAQHAVITGERRYFDDAAKQIKQFHKHLFVPAKGFFTHANDADNLEAHPHYFWGRANGWFMVATVELLDLLPADHPDRDALIKILNQQAKGIASVQSGTGLWRQMLDRPDSYLETSCTAMFAYSMAKGVNRGWLSASLYGPVAIAGWNGVTTRVSESGHVTGTCIGTAYANDYIYYYNRPSTDDVHGYGPVLLCGAEMLRLIENDKLRITGSTSQPVLVREKSE